MRWRRRSGRSDAWSARSSPSTGSAIRLCGGARTLARKGICMSKLERLLNDRSRICRLSNRHLVALCNLSIPVGIQGRSEIGQEGQLSTVYSSVRVDRTADSDSILNNAGNSHIIIVHLYQSG